MMEHIRHDSLLKSPLIKQGRWGRCMPLSMTAWWSVVERSWMGEWMNGWMVRKVDVKEVQKVCSL